MKKIFYSIIIIILSATIHSCSDDATDGIVDNSINNTESLLEQAKNRILSMGLDTTDMIEIDGYYVVENDILINKDSLFNVPLTQQYSATNTVATGQVITIGVDNTDLLTAWASALSRVASNYTNYTGMVFKFNGYDPDADIVISKANLFYSNVCAEGEFPVSSNAKPGKHVRINSVFYKDIDTYLSTNEKIFLMMHEIGHNLGLRHTDCAVNGEGVSDVGMVKIPGTPDTDSNSYMNSSTCGYSWTGMPEYDAVALNYLWPINYTIHFENCEGVDDLHLSYNGTGYVLDRHLIPVRDGYVFAGWHHNATFHTPYKYNFELTRERTLYAHWIVPEIFTTVSAHSYAGNSFTMMLNEIKTVTFNIKVYKGENTWEDIRKYDDTYFTISGGENLSYRKNMEYLMNVPETQPYVEYTETMVLTEGDYRYQSVFAKELGSQRGANDKHGYVYTTISYY